MQRIVLNWAAAALMSVAFGCGTQNLPAPQPVPRCQFDQKLKEQSAPNLPAAQAGELPSLMQNREDSKGAYKALYLKHRDQTSEVEACERAQAKATAAGSASPISQRIERAKERIRK